VLHGQLSFYETFPLGGASVQKQVNNMHTRTQIHTQTYTYGTIRCWRQTHSHCWLGNGGVERGLGCTTSKNIRFAAHKNLCTFVWVYIYVCVCGLGMFVSEFVFKYILISIYCFCRRLSLPFGQSLHLTPLGLPRRALNTCQIRHATATRRTTTATRG